MSNKEKVISLLDSIPDYKIGYVLAFIQGLTIDEEADNAFCMKLYQDYLNDPEHGETVSFEKALKECGVSLDEL